MLFYQPFQSDWIVCFNEYLSNFQGFLCHFVCLTFNNISLKENKVFLWCTFVFG